MIKTIRTCDMCNQEKSSKEIVTIEIRSIGGINIQKTSGYYGGVHNVDICPDCLKKYGFDVEKKHDEEYKAQAEANRKTLEDKVLDILSDLGVSFEG